MRTKVVVAAVALAVAGSAVGAAVGGTAAGGRDGLPRGSEPVVLDPAEFSTVIDNPYWPMRPGSRWVYRETDPDGGKLKVVVTVTTRTKKVANGVLARVVRDTVTENGSLVEDTIDYYAQDREGNVWYLGEQTTEYEDGKPISTAGSFEAGVDGAQAGIAMPARPKPGLAYRQEYLEGQAEDRATVVSIAEQVEVPGGYYRQVLMTRDVNPLKPRSLEFKFYARGVGPVLALGVSGGSDREELVRFTPGR